MELTIRVGAQNDLPQLLELYPHLDAVNVPFSIDVAKHRLAALRAFDGSAIFIGLIEEAIVCSCTLIVIPNLRMAERPTD